MRAEQRRGCTDAGVDGGDELGREAGPAEPVGERDRRRREAVAAGVARPPDPHTRPAARGPAPAGSRRIRSSGPGRRACTPAGPPARRRHRATASSSRATSAAAAASHLSVPGDRFTPGERGRGTAIRPPDDDAPRRSRSAWPPDDRLHPHPPAGRGLGGGGRDRPEHRIVRHLGGPREGGLDQHEHVVGSRRCRPDRCPSPCSRRRSGGRSADRLGDVERPHHRHLAAIIPNMIIL